MYQYKHSELLDLLLKFKNEDLITNDQKKIVKGNVKRVKIEMIINKSPEIDNILAEYNKDGNQKKLLSSLKVLCGDKPDSDDDTNVNSLEVNKELLN